MIQPQRLLCLRPCKRFAKLRPYRDPERINAFSWDAPFCKLVDEFLSGNDIGVAIQVFGKRYAGIVCGNIGYGWKFCAAMLQPRHHLARKQMRGDDDIKSFPAQVFSQTNRRPAIGQIDRRAKRQALTHFSKPIDHAKACGETLDKADICLVEPFSRIFSTEYVRIQQFGIPSSAQKLPSDRLRSGIVASACSTAQNQSVHNHPTFGFSCASLRIRMCISTIAAIMANPNWMPGEQCSAPITNGATA